jgi:hypothetical protein
VNVKPIPEDATLPAATGSEEGRNRLLRRVDWRFLLADPRPSRVISFSNDALAESMRLVSPEVIDGDEATRATDCDLALALEPAVESMERARDSLRPGGTLFSQWKSRSGRVRGGIRRGLERAGFEDVRLLWPRPGAAEEHPAAWIPLEAPGVLRYFFLENRGRSRTPWRRAARRVARSAFVMASRWRPRGTVGALARKPDARPRASHEELSNFILDRWDDWSLGPRPKSVSLLLLTGGSRSESKIVGLVFPEGSSRPQVALKMARTPESEASVVREGDVLRSLRDRVETETLKGVPRFLCLDRHGRVPVLGETAFVGLPLLSAWSEDNYGDLVLKASDWLADLAGIAAPCLPETWRRRLVDEPFEEFLRVFGRVLDAGLVREGERLLASLPALPIVCEQRDFSPWNVLLTKAGELAVVDWESAELQGLPGLDLFYFLLNVCFSFDDARRTGRYRESYRTMVDPETPRGALAARCLERYCDRVALDAGAVRPLRLLAWIVHSRSEWSRLQADFGPEASRDILRRAICVQLFEEELQSRANRVR